MQRRFSIILLALYLFGATEAYQLLKLPLLAIHFVQHCKEDPNMTLAGFLDMHYAGEMVYDDDWQDDMQLPFKTCQHGELSSMATITAEPLILPIPLIHEDNDVFTPHLPSLYGITKVTKIFQPPRPVIS
jgi:hypothetical protein